MDAFIDKVRLTVEKYNMLNKGDKVLVCVSGGPDSVALLYALLSLKKDLDLSLYVAHLDHMFRGRQSRQDMSFVEKMAHRLKLPIVVDRIDVPGMVKTKKISSEEGARMSRYEFFLKTARKIGALKVAIGHTLDDQAETVLMRIIRGSGLAGLSGIPPTRQLDGCLIIRPLIETTRFEVEIYLKRRKIETRLDLSNLETVYLRNKIRLQLLPLLEKDYNPRIKKILIDMAENLKSDYDYLSMMGQRAFLDSCIAAAGRVLLRTARSKDQVVISLKKLLGYHKAIQRQIARLAIAEVKGDLRRISYRHWRELDELIRFKITGSSIDLPGDIRVLKEYSKLVFYKKGRLLSKTGEVFTVDRRQLTKNVPKAVRVPGITDIPDLGLVVRTRVVEGSEFRKGQKKTEEFFDLDKIKIPLSVRFRRPGDKFRPLGMRRTKKVKDLFIDEKVPRNQRDNVPLVASGGKIIWVCGIRMADRVKVTDKTKKILKISVVRR